MNKGLVVLVLALLASGCTSTTTTSVKGRCFDQSGRPTCEFKPLPQLWQEAGLPNV